MSSQLCQSFISPTIISSSSITPKFAKTYPKTYHIPQNAAGTPCCHLRSPRLQPAPNSGHRSIPKYIPSIEYSNTRMFTRTWEAAVTHNKYEGGVLIIPGFQWHSGWFWKIAERLNYINMKVIAIDPLSTGKSDDIKSTRGYIPLPFPTIDIVSIINNEFDNNLPIFILCESSGVHTTLSLALNHSINVRGWILCGPALKISPGILPPKPILFFLNHVIAKLFPLLSTPQNVSGETFDLAFGDGGVSSTLAKVDPDVLFKTPIPMQTLRSTLHIINQIDQSLQKGELKLSNVLILHNKKDVRTDYNASKHFADKVKAESVRLVDPGGEAHQLFQERPDITLRVINDIIKFVETYK